MLPLKHFYLISQRVLRLTSLVLLVLYSFSNAERLQTGVAMLFFKLFLLNYQNYTYLKQI